MYRAKKAINLTLASLLVAVCTFPTVAQTTRSPNETEIPDEQTMKNYPGGGRPSSAPLEVLTRSTEVQKRLGLTPEQISALKKIEQEAQATRTRTRSATSSDVAGEISRTRDAVAGVLSPKQLEEFRGILSQVTGPQLEEAPSVRSRGVPSQKPIDLSNEQQQRLQEIDKQAQQSIRSAVVRTRSSDPQAACQEVLANRKKVEQARQAAQRQVEQTLTPEQRQAFKTQQSRSIGLATPSCTPPSQ